MTSALFTVKPTKSGRVKVKINKKGSKSPMVLYLDRTQAYDIIDMRKGGLESASGNGDQYYATKSGKLAKNQWVKMGLKEYYCGSNGAVTDIR